ncbi:MAG: cupin [Solivirus sp.]|uniref:Cupin n=1 Tax=Solivirus sp. TaxID=2487772 RepID=A0A3G5AFE2_9VIRU|nr:MAG: cupin [Solivirus sp.]
MNQTFLITRTDPTKKTETTESFRILREIDAYPKRYEIQSMSAANRLAIVIFDLYDNGQGDWKLLEQLIVPDPNSIVGEKMIQYVIRNDPYMTIELITAERIPYVAYADIEARANVEFRQVVSTGPYMQIVYQSLLPGTEIGVEQHMGTDQHFSMTSGNGRAEIVTDSKRYTYDLESGVTFHVKAGWKHNIINTGIDSLKFVTVYGGAVQHDAGLTERLPATKQT